VFLLPVQSGKKSFAVAEVLAEVGVMMTFNLHSLLLDTLFEEEVRLSLHFCKDKFLDYEQLYQPYFSGLIYGFLCDSFFYPGKT